jgi:hypothetical protein
MTRAFREVRYADRLLPYLLERRVLPKRARTGLVRFVRENWSGGIALMVRKRQKMAQRRIWVGKLIVSGVR